MLSSVLLKGKKVLVVDDDPNVLQTVGMMLRTAGMEGRYQTNAREALEALPEWRPDLILLDYMMPGMDGVAMYNAITGDARYEPFRHIPVVMLTAKTDNEEEQEQLLKSGLSAYLLKPFGFKELINIISNVLTLQAVRLDNLRLQQSLQAMKNHLQSIFNGIQDSISVQDTRYVIQSYNQSAARRFLRSDQARYQTENEVSGLLCHRVFFEEPDPCPFCPAALALSENRSHFTEIRHKDRHYQISIFPVENPHGSNDAFIEIIKDITEKKNLEERLVESSKLASIGTLATGVAHEINNPLCIILGFTQSLMKEIPAGTPQHEEMAIIEQETQRCAKIVQDLLNYAKPAPLKKQAAVLPEIIQNSLTLLRHLLSKRRVEVHETYPDEMPPVLVDAIKLQQVFINILLNAIESMNGNPRIDIHVQCTAASRIRIDVSDNGCGIPDALLDNVFDPFFTTKSGSGTGLGLSISQMIIKEHQGEIRIASRLQQGTTVTIELPLTINS